VITLYEYRAIIRTCYDGDTVRADIDLGFGIWKFNEPLRLFGINAPEMRNETIIAGRMSRDRLRQRIQGRTVFIRTHKDARDKFGRYLVEIWDPEHVNQWMVEQGLAVSFMDGSDG
jgi:micrococcal nuclease